MMIRKRNFARRALSMVEMVVSVAVISFVTITVAYLTIQSAKASKQGYSYLKGEARVRNGLDLVRRHALVGKHLSVKVEDNGHTLRYHNPWEKTDPYFAFSNGTLSFHPDENAAVLYTIDGLDDVSFELDNDKGNKILRFTITASVIDQHSVTREVSFVDEIALRNKANPNDLL